MRADRPSNNHPIADDKPSFSSEEVRSAFTFGSSDDAFDVSADQPCPQWDRDGLPTWLQDELHATLRPAERRVIATDEQTTSRRLRTLLATMAVASGLMAAWFIA